MKICLVCTGNTCRSPMAASLLRAYLQAEGMTAYEVCSAGLGASRGQPASAQALAVMADSFALDLSDHLAQLMNQKLAEESDLIITMTGQHKQLLVGFFPQAEAYTYSLAELVDQGQVDIEDPYGGSYDDYQRTAQELAELLKELIKKLKKDFLPNKED